MIFNAKIAVITFLGLLILSCSNAKRDYENTKKENTIQAYSEFIQKHPNSSFVKEAKSILDSLKYVLVSSKHSINEFEEFIQKNPNSKFIEAAKMKLDSLERKSLVNKLVATADKKAKSNKESAWWAYWFARIYSENDSILIEKSKELELKAFINLTDSDIKLSNGIFNKLVGEWFKNWPEPTIETDCVELRILMDSTVVGNLRCTTITVEGTTVLMFLNMPSMTVNEALDKYGKPVQDEKVQSKGIINRYLTHGRIRLVADKDGKIFSVWFNPPEK